jgi:hypothetical protein
MCYSPNSKNDAEGEYIDIDFDNLEIGKKYLVQYGGQQYLISKTADGCLSTAEVADRE